MPGHPALLTFLLLAGCQQVWGLERSIDAPLPPDAAPDAPVDAANCYGTGIVRVCLFKEPSGSFHAPALSELLVNTDGPICETYDGPLGLCVVSAEIMTINGTLRGRGLRPLVLVASASITVTGAIDVSSDAASGAGGDPVGCPGVGGNANSGGGAGGSFGGVGGRGGNGAVPGVGGTAAAAMTVTTLRGGCHGGNGANIGAAGLGGGAVFVIAGESLTVSGVVDASGNGAHGGNGAAVPGGGGGGGSGGMIGLDAPSISVTGSVFANGGGGGEGGGNPAIGEPGAKPQSAQTPAQGGTANTLPGGDGGDGSAGGMLNGTAGKAGGSGLGGGGGGGGGAGIIRVFPMTDLGLAVSPAPT